MRTLLVIACMGAVSLSAQWINQPVPGTPRLPGGKPNLAGPVPKAHNGKPDLSGIWQVEASPIQELLPLLPGGMNGLGEDIPSKYFINIFSDYKFGEEPLQPAAALQARKHMEGMAKDSPGVRCLPGGVPNAQLFPAPFKILQTNHVVALLNEGDNNFRQVFVDGRKHPADMLPTWNGYSVGRWEGDTLVVDTRGFNDRSWLDAMGHVHSEELQVVEKFHRRDFGHMDVEVTLTDPKVLTRPVTVKYVDRLLPDTDLIESICQENEKDAFHLDVH